VPTKIEKDAHTGRDTTGHEWDGLKELNNPLPKWWLYILLATIVWAVGTAFCIRRCRTARGIIMAVGVFAAQDGGC